jgi:hypothetical protein
VTGQIIAMNPAHAVLVASCDDPDRPHRLTARRFGVVAAAAHAGGLHGGPENFEQRALSCSPRSCANLVGFVGRQDRRAVPPLPYRPIGRLG